MHRTLVSEKDLSRILKTVENPGRYVGGEYGIHCDSDAPFRVGICFPDLYEIGMSNQALAQLYGIVNTTEGAAGERVFTVASDFEESLRIAGIPLYGLDSGTPLSAFDLLTVTFSYELSATNFLAILQAGQVPLRSQDRGEDDPIVLGGGPAATNPLPLGDFLEGVYIGEAEEDFASLLPELISLKKRGAQREDLVQRIRECPSIWYKGKKEKTTRSVFRSFPVAPSYSRWFPVPNLKTAQDHGVVEIMRGCPNGCRFCHAGIFYRPFRMKPFSLVQEEVSWEVLKKGFREISLSSLSSGDYIGISSLMKKLNACFRDRLVSFGLPSLHIETFGLELLRDISEVRKSGLTFAVETPDPALQRALNKQADQEQIVRILLRAKEQGWKLAKFYFMIGLPFQDREKEREEIIEFIRSIQKSTGIQIHLNVGTFIPKPHTPFQWAGQLTEAQSLESIQTIRTGLRHLPVKVGYQAPFLSFLEGVICRGDAGVGELIGKAFQEGARFDAWEDKINRKAWETAFKIAGGDVEFSTCSPRPIETDPPWSCIDLGVTPSFLRKEYSRAQSCTETTPCDVSCEHPCGVCNHTLKPVIHDQEKSSSITQSSSAGRKQKRTIYRYILSFQKLGKSAYIPHLSLLRVMERSVQRAGLIPRFTTGFNPKPSFEFAQPLPLGFESLDELFSVELLDDVDPETLIDRLNSVLPEGLRFYRGFQIAYPEISKKPPSLMSCYGGGLYRIKITGETLESILPCILNDTSLQIESISSSKASIYVPVSLQGTLKKAFSSLLSNKNILSIDISREISYSIQDRVPLFEYLYQIRDNFSE
jgi:radical SAM family uncharacterized protein/radical SAM-linked protein